MALSKLAKMQRFVPDLYRPRINPNVRGLLYAWSGEDDLIVEAAKDAKEQLFVALAQQQYLDALGSNVGVFRPTAFNLSDTLFRKLIPALSYYPKQVIPTIWSVLEVFFGENNSKVKVNEIYPNQIEIQIPSSVPALRRTLRGSHHFHNYSGEIVSIDNFAKEVVINLDGTDKELRVDECEDALFGQGYEVEYVLSNSIGNDNVTLQFPASSNLSKFTVGERFMMALPGYPGSFMADPTSSFSVTKQRGKLNQVINIGDIVPSVSMQDASGIPDSPGYIVFNFGKPNEESLIRYFGRPNNSTILVDPAYVFTKDHAIGELVNVIVTPYQKPKRDGSDYSIYIVGVTAARLLAQQIIKSIVAAGVVVNFTIVGPEIGC